MPGERLPIRTVRDVRREWPGVEGVVVGGVVDALHVDRVVELECLADDQVVGFVACQKDVVVVQYRETPHHEG